VGALEGSALHWVAALLPLLVVLVSMLRLGWGGHWAGLAGLAAAAGLALTAFGADPFLLGVALWKAAVLSFYVLYIIWAALILYHIVDEAGAIRSIGAGVAALTEDHIMQLLILGFAFSSFLQGVAGFGVPVVVVAPLLVGLGFPAVQAAAVPLVGHAWSVTMGDLASSFQALVAVTGLPAKTLAYWASLFLGVACLFSGFSVAHLHAGFRPIRRCFGAILSLSLAMAAVQFALAVGGYWILAGFGAGLLGLLLSLTGARVSARTPVSLLGLLPRWPAPDGRRDAVHREARIDGAGRVMGFHLAFSAYYLLILVVGLATLVPAIHEGLGGLAVPVAFPRTVTAYGWVTHHSRQSLTLFGHPGALLLYTSVLAWAVYAATGNFASRRWRSVLVRTVDQGIPTSLAILAMVSMATVMAHSGMTYLLAKGLTAVAGPFYPLISPFIGLLGCFVTGSNTNSNVLFGGLQRDAAVLLGKNPAVMAGLQTAGGALGSMIAPAKVLVGCATVGLSGSEGEVMRLTLRYCLPMTIAVGLLGWAVLALS
jgi:lactate permease